MAIGSLLRGAAAIGFSADSWSSWFANPPAVENTAAPPIVLASPVGSFHNVTLQIYAQVMRDMGHTVTTVTDIEHAKMYPHFTGAGGAERYIDIVVSSDLPNNHVAWLGDYKDTFNVVGTCYDLLQIYLAVPTYVNANSLADLKTTPGMNKTLIGFDVDPCARCPDLVDVWTKEVLGEGFVYAPSSQHDLEKELKRKIAAKEVFATTFWSPTYWNALFPDLKQLDMGKFTSKLFNQGKAVVSVNSPLITDPAYARTLRAVSSVFLGTKEVNQMDYKVYKMQKEGGASADNAPYVVAQEWIKDNKDTYEMFKWR